MKIKEVKAMLEVIQAAQNEISEQIAKTYLKGKGAPDMETVKAILYRKEGASIATIGIAHALMNSLGIVGEMTLHVGEGDDRKYILGKDSGVEMVPIKDGEDEG